jgi:hypothetical protein
MFPTNTENRRSINISAVDTAEYLPIIVEAFLLDRRTQRLTGGTIKFYQEKWKLFLDLSESHAFTQITELTPDYFRQFILYMGEKMYPYGM